jgi:hypothetical protein
MVSQRSTTINGRCPIFVPEPRHATRGYVLFFPESGVVFSHTHLSAYSCILMHFQHFHCISSDCILHLLHGIAYDCILTHLCMLHSEVDAFAYLHTHFQCCIWYIVHSCAFKCIQIWMHFRSMLHSRACIAQDAFTCILCMLHSIHAAS